MSMIKVRAKKGVVAYSAPRGGVRIPDDKFIDVDASPYLYRLATHWGDIDIAPAAEPVKNDTPTQAPAVLAPAVLAGAGAAPAADAPVAKSK